MCAIAGGREVCHVGGGGVVLAGHDVGRGHSGGGEEGDGPEDGRELHAVVVVVVVLDWMMCMLGFSTCKKDNLPETG